MPGPYFKDQQPQKCGCYYPDITRMRDRKGARTLFCLRHGIIEEPFDGVPGPEYPVPDGAWRKRERQRLKNLRRFGK